MVNIILPPFILLVRRFVIVGLTQHYDLCIDVLVRNGGSGTTYKPKRSYQVRSLSIDNLDDA